MRRYVALILIGLAVVIALSGCRPLIQEEGEAISIYATFYPIYALTEAVMRDVPDTVLHLMAQPQDGCLRSYQLSDWDFYLLSGGADGIIMGGRGLESFESALFSWGDVGPAVSAVLYNLELYNQGETVAGGESESHLAGANPHLYMSIEGSKRMIESIAASLQSMDPKYSALYVQNAQSAEKRLNALLDQTKASLSEFAGGRVILMNEALIYPAQEYALEVADWIDRESGEALYDDALKDCLDRLERSDARVVLIEKQAPQAFVKAIEAAGFAVAKLDILSAHREGESFDVYIDLLTSNARAIRDAFARAETGEGAE